MICIIDYGVGNIGSIRNMVKKIGHDSIVSSDPDVIQKADKIILSGVGSFDYGMNKIKNSGLYELIQKLVIVDKKPILGICLGMQLMTNRSAEGDAPGFGWIDAEVLKFDLLNLKIPHMGWNLITIEKKNSLSNNLYSENRFYFVHSYYVTCNNQEDILFMTEYGNKFVSGFSKDNIYGVQFHPEKSHKFGKRIFENFCALGEDYAKK